MYKTNRKWQKNRIFVRIVIEIKDETDKIIEQANEIVLKEKENHEQKTEI